MNNGMTPDPQKTSDSGCAELAIEIAAIQPRLYGFILKRLADREQTLEVLQRTNLVICRKADEFQQGSNFTAWAFTIAKFQVMAWRKSAGAERLVLTDQVYELVDKAAEREATEVDERIPFLRQCLQTLRDTDRDLIKRRYRDGEQLEPLAESLAKSVDAIGMRLTRVRRQLANCVRASMDREVRYDH